MSEENKTAMELCSQCEGIAITNCVDCDDDLCEDCTFLSDSCDETLCDDCKTNRENNE